MTAVLTREDKIDAKCSDSQSDLICGAADDFDSLIKAAADVCTPEYDNLDAIED
jgi:hypothetical protein